MLERERPELANRRKTFQKSIDALQSALGKASSDLAETAGGSDAGERVKSLAAALVAARTESALLEAEFDAWFAAKFPEETTHYQYTVSTDQLPGLDHPLDEAWFAKEDLRGQAREAAETLGVIVARIGDHDPTPHSEPDEQVHGIRFLFPRLLRLGVYEVEADGATMRILGENEADDEVAEKLHGRLRRLSPAWVVDQYSEVGVMRMKASLFEKHGASAEFGEAGTLTAFTNKKTGTGRDFQGVKHRRRAGSGVARSGCEGESRFPGSKRPQASRSPRSG